MTSHITLWGRTGDTDSKQALAFLRRHGFAADRVLDIDRSPPDPAQRRAIESAGGPLADPLPAPILLTPKGALVGFRERRWARFLGLDKLHDG
jgi:arsenate reductase-like glutaredoxin family protein